MINKVKYWMRDHFDAGQWIISRVEDPDIFYILVGIVMLQIMALLGTITLGDISKPIIMWLVRIQLVFMVLETIFVTITLIAGCIYGAYRYEEDLHVED